MLTVCQQNAVRGAETVRYVRTSSCFALARYVLISYEVEKLRTDRSRYFQQLRAYNAAVSKDIGKNA